ncbi:uncharacterized protein LOC132047883 [Lycium ferocissimum]|uniref:uncharacterized protein LOC132047883 n=1 Tax=Lycium ferocissimum TaxID=112874 RepID=UPI0028153189|nr:uncharacterized protein LOC132047883 [Lycium ferocissimum]
MVQHAPKSITKKQSLVTIPNSMQVAVAKEGNLYKENTASQATGVHTRRTASKPQVFDGAISTSLKDEKLQKKVGARDCYLQCFWQIWAFVDEEYEVTVLMDTVQQLTLKLFNCDIDMEMVVTLVYAKCDRIERIELWDSLYNLASDMTIPWLVGGDFNVITDEEEKYGVLPVSLNEVEDFRHCIQTCNLTDLGFKGSVFTWWNGRAADDGVFKRLDKCLGNFEFQQLFPGLEITHLIKFGSITLLRLNANKSMKLKKMKHTLSQWSKSTYGDIFQQITNLQEVIKAHEALFESNPSYANKEKLMNVQAELTRVLYLEEEFWKQKAGMSWFQDGDKNSKFFHAHVKGGRKIFELKRIRNSQGQWLGNEKEVAKEAVGFFQAQFHETVVPTQFDILKHVPSMISNEQNEELVAVPTKEEVKQAVFGLNSASASGPDGFTEPRFSKHAGMLLVMIFSTWFGTSLEVLNCQGFVRGRSIVENILLTQEIITDIRLRTNKGKKNANAIVPNFVMKLDMTKPHGFFHSTRGVKQGDPLSPTLFILAAEVLSRGLYALYNNLWFTGFGLPKWSPKINHLAYADDTIIFPSACEISLV